MVERMKRAFRWYLFAVKCIVNFHGRAGREEIWSFFIFQTIFMSLCALGDLLITGFPILLPAYAALTAIPTILVMIRRLHDCNLSGWWVILAILPPFCFFVMSWAPDPFQPNLYGTTERLSHEERAVKTPPPIIDGVEYLTKPDFTPQLRRQRDEEQYEKDLKSIIGTQDKGVNKDERQKG